MPSLDEWQKITQICFWTVSGTIVILTYLRARKSVLSTVNTEYQKRVMDRLQKLSEDLYSEFDQSSPEHWSRPQDDFYNYFVKPINESFDRSRQKILNERHLEFHYSIPLPPKINELHHKLDAIKSDPFIPQQIRETIKDLTEERFSVHMTTCIELCTEYQKMLATGGCMPLDQSNYLWLSNIMNDRLYSRGCGIGQIQAEVHAIRLEIQKYFESFDPR